jgi:hypothetical protein
MQRSDCLFEAMYYLVFSDEAKYLRRSRLRARSACRTGTQKLNVMRLSRRSG